MFNSAFGRHASLTTRFARGGQVRGVVVSEANYVRWTNYVRRANYVRSTNYAEPRSSLQSVLRFALCSAFRKIPNFEKSSWIFFHFKKLLIAQQITASHGRRYGLRCVPRYGPHYEKFPILKIQVGFFSTLKSV